MLVHTYSAVQFCEQPKPRGIARGAGEHMPWAWEGEGHQKGPVYGEENTVSENNAISSKSGNYQ